LDCRVLICSIEIIWVRRIGGAKTAVAADQVVAPNIWIACEHMSSIVLSTADDFAAGIVYGGPVELSYS
jgi:hypothetical protein